jgi:hypothetical protein
MTFTVPNLEAFNAKDNPAIPLPTIKKSDSIMISSQENVSRETCNNNSIQKPKCFFHKIARNC